MKKTYAEFINEKHDFPQESLDLDDGYLSFHGVSIKYLIEKYGSPFKVMYLPRIADQINRARKIFNEAIEKHQYRGQYFYCYCTKCSHYSHVVKAAVREKVQLETSSAFDIDIIRKLYEDGEIDKEIILIHNGYKTDEYLQKIVELNKDGFINSILVLDAISELTRVKKIIPTGATPIKLGIRLAIDEKIHLPYQTSRLGIAPSKILDFYRKEIKNEDAFNLKMLHFFIDSGIEDSNYYWSEFQKAMKLYVELKEECAGLKAIDLGGGFPIKNHLDFDFNYELIADKIVKKIKETCIQARIDEPNIFTEFGKYTVGESGALIFTILEHKAQSQSENWYLIDNSLMNTIPDAWSNFEKFIMLPINKWRNESVAVKVGGISCDHTDFYQTENGEAEVILPGLTGNDNEPLYIGFFNTGAYQDSLSGYGGVKHCLIPTPKMIVVDKDENGNIIDYIYQEEQTAKDVLEVLGYH